MASVGQAAKMYELHVDDGGVADRAAVAEEVATLTARLAPEDSAEQLGDENK